MSRHKRTCEAAIAGAVVKLLQDTGGSATIRQIRKSLPSYVGLSGDDMVPSATRPRERLWEQQVRNIVSHRHHELNFINRGILEYSPRRLSLGRRDISGGSQDR